MQTREELKQKGPNGSQKNYVLRDGEKLSFSEGGGINNVF
jgi:hypothetical protein